jgi:hypothetical protein
MLPPSMEGQSCSRPDMKKDETKKPKLLHGHDATPDGTGGYYWYSNLDSSVYCAEDGAYFLWHSRHVVGEPKEMGKCKILKKEYKKFDIQVSDWHD